MKKLLTILGITLALPLLAGDEKIESQRFGTRLDDAQPVTIADLLTRPESFVGKPVRIEGLITDVCPMRGCWIDVKDRESASTIRFKVTDGEIVFPMDAKGKPVRAEGVFARMELDAEQADRYRRHLAEELDKPFDAEAESGPMVVYRIDGVGATLR